MKVLLNMSEKLVEEGAWGSAIIHDKTEFSLFSQKSQKILIFS